MYKEGVNPFEIMLNKKVQAITTDGRVFCGEERVYSLETGVQFLNAGLQVIRGDTVAVLGEINLEKEKSIDFDKVKANQLAPIFSNTH
ncbi:unnamed protein product [Paramecium pentaurelia]|uniref:Uncharacterized protein n=1 Tax=Paramecium pentaurelia TaxID=43138 RepID=A0A8S1XZK6_9CILI|nr:unnamed protein product [Paramecium pentaurelia]